jgi:hypothetical protein
MSDRVSGFVVVLDGHYTAEQAERIRVALSMIQGVALVTPNVASASEHIAKEGARLEVVDRVFKALRPG